MLLFYIIILSFRKEPATYPQTRCQKEKRVRRGVSAKLKPGWQPRSWDFLCWKLQCIDILNQCRNSVYEENSETFTIARRSRSQVAISSCQALFWDCQDSFYYEYM